MLRYTHRTREVALSLLGCESAVQDVYNMIEFHRPPDSEVSNAMSVGKLSEISNVGRRHIYRVLDELVDRELIEMAKTKRRGVYHFILLKLKPAEVIQLPGNQASQREAETAASEAEFLTGLGD